jgi:hypothetical protein
MNKTILNTTPPVSGGYWQCKPCGHIGEPIDAGEHNQRCANCNEYAVHWIEPKREQIDNRQSAIGNGQSAKVEEERKRPVSTIRSAVRCSVCDQPAFILVKVFIAYETPPEGWMCRACLAGDGKAPNTKLQAPEKLQAASSNGGGR